MLLYICIGVICLLIATIIWFTFIWSSFIRSIFTGGVLKDFEERRHQHQLECIAMQYALDRYGEDRYISADVTEELRSVMQFVQHDLHE